MTDADAADGGLGMLEWLERLRLSGVPDDPLGGPTGIIESSPLGLTTNITKLAKAVGGVTVVAGSLSGVWAGIADNTPLVIAIIGGVAVILAALAVGMSKVVHADVAGRATATAAQLDAGGVAVKARLDNAGGGPDPSVGTMEDGLRLALVCSAVLHVTTADGTDAVDGVHWINGEDPRIRLAGGDIIDLTEVRSFSTGRGASRERTSSD